MDTSEWIYQIIVEGMKYIIIAHWFLGFTFSQKKDKIFFAHIPCSCSSCTISGHTTYSFSLLLLLGVVIVGCCI